MSVLPQVVTRNWRLKLAALALSVFLWAVVTVQPRNREVLPTVPVEVEIADEGWTLAEPPSPQTVAVNLGGLTRDLLDLPRGQEARVRIPIETVTSPDTIVRLRVDWVVLSAGSNIVVQDITPVAVSLRFERTRTKAVPLSLQTVGELPEELALVAPLGWSPQVTTVTGPARLVDQVESVELEPLDLGDITQSGAHRVSIDTTDLEGLAFEPRVAQVSVNVQQAVEREVTGVPVRVEAPPGVDSATLVPQPATVDVILRGAMTPVMQVDPGALTAVVSAQDLEGIAAGSEWVAPVEVRGAPQLVRARPSVDSVRVVRAPSAPLPPASPDTASGAGAAAPDTLPARPGAGVRP